MTTEITLTVRVLADCTMTEAAKRVQDVLEADRTKTGIYVVSVDRIVKARQQ